MTESNLSVNSMVTTDGIAADKDMAVGMTTLAKKSQHKSASDYAPPKDITH